MRLLLEGHRVAVGLDDLVVHRTNAALLAGRIASTRGHEPTYTAHRSIGLCRARGGERADRRLGRSRARKLGHLHALGWDDRDRLLVIPFASDVEGVLPLARGNRIALLAVQD